jgi:hypothetical protein
LSGAAGSGWGVRRGRWGVQFEQWAMAAAPRQPVFCGMLDLIRARLDEDEAAGGAGGGGGGRGAAAAAAFGSGGGRAGGGGGGGGSGVKGSEHAQDWGVLHRTGPHVWTDSVLRWMNLRGVGFHEALLPGGALVRDRRPAGGGGGGGGAGAPASSSSSSALSARVMPPEAFGCAAHFFAADTNLEDVHVMHMFRGVWRARRDEDEEGGAVGGESAPAAAAGPGRR